MAIQKRKSYEQHDIERGDRMRSPVGDPSDGNTTTLGSSSLNIDASTGSPSQPGDFSQSDDAQSDMENLINLNPGDFTEDDIDLDRDTETDETLGEESNELDDLEMVDRTGSTKIPKSSDVNRSNEDNEEEENVFIDIDSDETIDEPEVENTDNDRISFDPKKLASGY